MREILLLGVYGRCYLRPHKIIVQIHGQDAKRKIGLPSVHRIGKNGAGSYSRTMRSLWVSSSLSFRLAGTVPSNPIQFS